MKLHTTTKHRHDKNALVHPVNAALLCTVFMQPPATSTRYLVRPVPRISSSYVPKHMQQTLGLTTSPSNRGFFGCLPVIAWVFRFLRSTPEVWHVIGSAWFSTLFCIFYLSPSAAHALFSSLLFCFPLPFLFSHWSSVLIHPLSLRSYFVPGISCAVQAWLRFFTSKMAAQLHSHMQQCLLALSSLMLQLYWTFFVSLSAITLRALGSNGIPVSSTLYTWVGRETRSSSEVLVDFFCVHGIHPAVSSTVSASQCQVFMPSKESMEPSLSYSLIAQNPLQGSERLGNCHYISMSSHTQMQSTVAKFTKFLLFTLVKVGLRACLVFILCLSCQSVFKHCSEITMVHCSSVDRAP